MVGLKVFAIRVAYLIGIVFFRFTFSFSMFSHNLRTLKQTKKTIFTIRNRFHSLSRHFKCSAFGGGNANNGFDTNRNPSSFRTVQRFSNSKDPQDGTIPKKSESFNLQDVPDETLYILDGTAMLFQAHFSRENQNDWQNNEVFLHEDLSAKIIEKWSMEMQQCDIDPSTSFLFREGSAVNENMLADYNIFFRPKFITQPLIDEETIDTNQVNSDTTTEDRVPVVGCGALTTMAVQFARFIHDVRPRYLVVAFDAGKKTFRDEKYPAYKQNRKPVCMCKYIYVFIL